VVKDFDLVEQHRDRVLVGLSLTAPPGKADVMRVLEPHQALIHTIQALQQVGYTTEAATVGKIRTKVEWSAYTVRLATNLQEVLRRRGALDKLRFLLYPSNLTEADAAELRRQGDGIVWLGKK
jgi:hypothetical protein